MRILDNIRSRAPQEWRIQHQPLPATLPSVVEEPEGVVKELRLSGDWTLILFMGESQSAFSLLPEIVKQVSAPAVIAPADDYSWLPLGLERQIRMELEEMGVNAVFPRPFCSLAPMGVPPVDDFARIFGSPHLRLEAEEGTVKRVEVLRGAPCGSTWYMVERLPGSRVDEAGERAATLVQIYPCLASRRIEHPFSDAPIHVAARIVKKGVDDALERRKE